MIDANAKAFENLINQLLSHENFEVEAGRRYIRTNDEEKNWLKYAQIEDVLNINSNLRCVLIKLDNVLYGITVGLKLDYSDVDESIIKEIDVNSGLVTLLVSEELLLLDKKADFLRFYDTILFQHKDADYKGHNFEDILDFTEQLSVFEFPKLSPIKDDYLNRVSCFIFCKNSTQLVLEFDENVLSTIGQLGLIGSDDISYRILLDCLFSNTYKHAFLEAYRLIERLFPINYISEFHKAAKPQMSFMEFTAALENFTGWKPKEEDAVSKIFDSRKDKTKAHFDDFVASFTSFDMSVDKYFYKLRNSIVHFRANHEEVNLSKNQWNLLLLSTLNLLDDQYSYYGQIVRN